MFWEAIGVSAAILTMFSFVPQIIKAIKIKSVKDVSIITLLQLSLGVLLWIAYGIHLKNPVIIAANSVTLLSLSILLFLYYIYSKPKGGSL
ncbi:MAG: SemiSWEET family transporter [Candidatus Omnitrophota bacterium]